VKFYAKVRARMNAKIEMYANECASNHTNRAARYKPLPFSLFANPLPYFALLRRGAHTHKRAHKCRERPVIAAAAERERKKWQAAASARSIWRVLPRAAESN